MENERHRLNPRLLHFGAMMLVGLGLWIIIIKAALYLWHLIF